jgi:hypothetical protein
MKQVEAEEEKCTYPGVRTVMTGVKRTQHAFVEGGYVTEGDRIGPMARFRSS